MLTMNVNGHTCARNSRKALALLAVVSCFLLLMPHGVAAAQDGLTETQAEMLSLYILRIAGIEPPGENKYEKAERAYEIIQEYQGDVTLEDFVYSPLIEGVYLSDGVIKMTANTIAALVNIRNYVDSEYNRTIIPVYDLYATPSDEQKYQYFVTRQYGATTRIAIQGGNYIDIYDHKDPNFEVEWARVDIVKSPLEHVSAPYTERTSYRYGQTLYIWCREWSQPGYAVIYWTDIPNARWNTFGVQNAIIYVGYQSEGQWNVDQTVEIGTEYYNPDIPWYVQTIGEYMDYNEDAPPIRYAVSVPVVTAEPTAPPVEYPDDGEGNPVYGVNLTEYEVERPEAIGSIYRFLHDCMPGEIWVYLWFAVAAMVVVGVYRRMIE